VPENPDYYSEPTQAAHYGGFEGGYGGGYDYQPPEPPAPWYRRPAALVAAGAIGIVVLALVAYAVFTLVSGSPTHSPATTTTTTTAPTTAAPEPRGHHGGGGGEQPQTVTETAPPPSTDTGTTVAPSTVTVSPSTETSTVTQTETVPQRRGPFGQRP
jgi:hypothetical protein